MLHHCCNIDEVVNLFSARLIIIPGLRCTLATSESNWHFSSLSMQYLFLASARCKQHTLFGIFSRPGKSHCKVSLPYMTVNCWSCQPVPGQASITYLNVLSILAPVIYLSVVSQCIPARLCRHLFSVIHLSVIAHSLSSDRQHLNYDACLEVRGKIIRTVLCCIIVYWSCAQS